MAQAPCELSTAVMLSSNRVAPIAFVTAVVATDEPSTAQQAIQPLLDIGDVTLQHTHIVPYTDFVSPAHLHPSTGLMPLTTMHGLLAEMPPALPTPWRRHDSPPMSIAITEHWLSLRRSHRTIGRTCQSYGRPWPRTRTGRTGTPRAYPTAPPSPVPAPGRSPVTGAASCGGATNPTASCTTSRNTKRAAGPNGHS